jgi:putative FmdB family regulatory protein
MPTYEYACSACNHHFEQWQSFSAAAMTECPRCGQPRLVRLFGSGGAIIFKGSGFYETDYRRPEAQRGNSIRQPHHTDQPHTTASTSSNTDPSATGGDIPKSPPSATSNDSHRE